MRYFSFRTLLLLFILLIFVKAHVKLNVPRVRLPYFEHLAINFTLKVETQGCYRWSVSRQDVITITTKSDSSDFEDSKCSDTAILSTIPRIGQHHGFTQLPANAIVYVEDTVTQETVRCDVVIDKLSSISLITDSRELHLEEAPSKFRINGFGSNDNIFSTLDGIPFKWWIEGSGVSSAGQTAATDILRFLPFSESTYIATEGIAHLESQRLQGSTVLVEGLKTGSAKVLAKLTDSLYKHVVPAEANIIVVANLKLEPSEAFIVPESTIPLKLFQMKFGKFIEIKLPSPVYEFKVSNKSVIDYNAKTSTITALNYGETKITMKSTETQMLDPESASEAASQSVMVYVREPKFLSLSVHPYRNWAVVIGQEYEVFVDIYDSENQKIMITNNLQVVTEFDETLFKLDGSSNNGTYHYGTPKKMGTCKIKAELRDIIKRDGSKIKLSPTPRVKAEMEIYQRIAINPRESILPWDPVIRPKHEIRLNPSGGNGNFFWSTTNSSIVTVNQGGIAKTEWLGGATITASMTINTNIRGQAKVYVLPPTRMKIVDTIVEAEIGIPILVPVAFYTVRPDDVDGTEVPYSNCRDLPYKVDIEEPMFSHSPGIYPPMKPSCLVVPIVGSDLGSSRVKISYTLDQDTIYTDSVIVSTFRPLKVVEPVSKQTVLAVGSSKQLAFEGGPRPHLQKQAGFFKRFSVYNETVARHNYIKHSGKDDLYIYEILCTEVGETEISLEIGNMQANDLLKPAISRMAIVNVICGEPTQLYFKIENYEKDLKCPFGSELSSGKISIPNYEDTRISVIVKDENGKRFDNISSLEIEWTANKPNLIKFDSPNFILTDKIEGPGWIVHGKSFQTLIPHGESGEVEIKAAIKGYRNEILKKYQLKNIKLIKPQDFDDETYLDSISHSMELQLVSDFSCDPSLVTIFNHPSSKALVRIKEGSGHFQIINNGGGQFSQIKYHDSNKTLEILPFEEGVTRLTIKDLCLSSSKSASMELLIQIIGVHSVEIEPETDKILVGKETVLKASILDQYGNPLASNVLHLVRLRFDTGVTVNGLDITQTKKDTNHIYYKIMGKSIGVYSISLMADVNGKIVRSSPKVIHIYPPLKLNPRNLNLLVGSHYQITSTGGPQTLGGPDTITEFSTEGQQYISIEHNGLLQGKAIGKTMVHGKCMNRNPSSINYIYSEDSMEVKVVQLKGVRIHTPLLRIQSGQEMPIWANGIGSNLEPTILTGGNDPLLSLSWTAGNNEIAELFHVYEKNKVIPGEGDQVSLKFKAKHAGHVRIKLVVKFGKDIFTDEVEIEVFEKLQFTHVKHDYQPLLMTPNSEMQLKTNRDSSSIVNFAVQHLFTPSCPDILSEACRNRFDRAIVTVDQQGIIRSSDQMGQAVVFVTVREDFGIVQTISLVLEVKGISYLMASPVLNNPPAQDFKGSNSTIPRGKNFQFAVTYHDNFGRIFSATNASPKIRPNRFDQIQISSPEEDHIFNVLALVEGRTTLKFYDEKYSNLSDFILLNIKESPIPIIEQETEVDDSSKVRSPLQKTIGTILDGSASIKLGKGTHIIEQTPTCKQEVEEALKHIPSYNQKERSFLEFVYEKLSKWFEVCLIVILTLVVISLCYRAYRYKNQPVPAQNNSVFYNNPNPLLTSTPIREYSFTSQNNLSGRESNSPKSSPSSSFNNRGTRLYSTTSDAYFYNSPKSFDRYSTS